MTRAIRPRWLLAGLAATLLSLAGAMVSAQRSEASFITGKCLGEDVLGRGASFARDAHAAWKQQFQLGYCSAVGEFPVVSYDAAGSGAGRRAMGEHGTGNVDGANSRLADGPRFGMTDEPPSPTSIAQMNQGTPAPGDEGQVHVVPAAVGAVGIVVNFPNDCDRTLLDDASETAPAATNFTNRVRFTKSELEAVFAGDPGADTWSEVFSELGGDADCAVPIRRVVRFDSSGTTFTVKDFFNRINPARDWDTLGNTAWPNSGGAGAPLNGGANGNGPLVTKLLATDSSIGYSDISTARVGGLAIEPTTIAANRDDDVFWTQVENGSNVYREPTEDPSGFTTVGTKGADCDETVFTDVPASTLGDWAPVSGVNSAQGYGICTLTYGLVFDDHATAYGLFSPSVEEPKARSVKDYWTALLEGSGQAVLPSSDYAPLPAGILAIARAGIASVDWNKAAGGGGGGGGGGGSGGGGGGGGGGTTPPPAPVAPSNVFSVPRTALSSRNGTATFSIRVPGAGRLDLVGTANVPGGRASRRIVVGRARRSVGRAGTFTLTLKPGSAAKKRLRRTRRLRVRVTLTYTPAGGTARSSTRTVTLKLEEAAPLTRPNDRAVHDARVRRGPGRPPRL